MDRVPNGINGVIMEGNFTVCLYFQDLNTGDVRAVYPQGMTGEEIVKLLSDPSKQFAPVPPPPPPPPYPTKGE